MTLPNYAAMTVTELTNAVAKLLLHTSPMAKAGKGWLNPFAMAGKTGECTGPGTCTSLPLLTAMHTQGHAQPGDTADETERRAWLHRIVSHGNVVMWSGGNSILLQHQHSGDFYSQARRYAALA
jgi:hypothetical protein